MTHTAVCECGRVSATYTNLTLLNLRCWRCPPAITERWWFRLDEWCHRHLPRWAHRLLCLYVERRLWGIPKGGTV